MHRSSITRRPRLAAAGALGAALAALALGSPAALAAPSCQPSGSDTVCTFESSRLARGTCKAARLETSETPAADDVALGPERRA
jgi:hypothetical protein